MKYLHCEIFSDENVGKFSIATVRSNISPNPCHTILRCKEQSDGITNPRISIQSGIKIVVPYNQIENIYTTIQKNSIDRTAKKWYFILKDKFLEGW